MQKSGQMVLKESIGYTMIKLGQMVFQCVPNWLISSPYDLILHCVPTFNNVYPIDSFQHHMTWFLHCLLNWLLSRSFDLILSRCTQLTPFNTIWPDFTLCTCFINVCPIDSFQHHMTWFLHCVHKWLLSRPFDLILERSELGTHR